MSNVRDHSIESMSKHLEQYENLELASIKDNKEILDFLVKVPMESDDFSLRYNRAPDFFKLLEAQGNQSFVFKMLNKDKSLGGLGVITTRKCWFNNKESLIAYTSDLRVSPLLYKRTRLEWRKLYTDYIRDYKSINELKDIAFFHTAVLDDNEKAIKSLKSKKSKFVYNDICPYRSISLYGRLPLSSNKVAYKIESNLSAHQIESFLSKCHKNLPAGQFYQVDHPESEFNKRKKNLSEYDAQNFLVIRNEYGEIKAAMVPIDTASLREIVIDKMNWRYKLLSYLTPLLKGKRLKVGESLNILYMSDLTFADDIGDKEKSELTLSFINYLYCHKHHKNYHLITFIDYYNESLLNILRKDGHFFETKAGTIYQVSHIDHKESDSLVSPCQNMAFELALS